MKYFLDRSIRPRVRSSPMPAISVYLKDSLLASIRAHTAKTGQPVSAFLATAAAKALYQDRPRACCVGKDRVSWTAAMPADDANRTHLEASAMHPGIEVYYLPFDADTSAIAPGAPIPEGATVTP